MELAPIRQSAVAAGGRAARSPLHYRRCAPGSKMGIGQVLMDKGDRHAALTNPRSTALDRAEPDIAGGEHAGVASLQQERFTIEPPVRRTRQLAAGADKALGVGLNLRRQPVGARNSPDE